MTSWVATPANRDLFNWLSHTYTHVNLDNRTYHDAWREAAFNKIFAE